jgi:hypothetical protein
MERGNPQKMGWETNSRVKVKFCFVEIQGNGKSFSTGLLTVLPLRGSLLKKAVNYSAPYGSG